MRAPVRLLMAAVLWAVASVNAHAHKSSDAYLQLDVKGAHIEQRLDIALRDLDRDLVLDANDDGQLTWGEVRARWADIDRLAQTVRITDDGAPCTAGPAGAPQLDEHSDGRYAVLTRRWTCPSDVHALRIDYPLFVRSDPTHRGIARFTFGGLTRSMVLVPGAEAQRVVLDETPSLSVAGFIGEGVHHILIGIDHILFLLALLLPAVLVRTKPGKGDAWQPATSWRATLLDVLRVVTAFTVAHSITLALAVLNVIDPPSRWVETIIAASVVLAALNNLYPVVGHGRWKLTFAFGLVHGFGFAGALKDLGLGQGSLAGPLFGFNFGVELGQLGIVAVFLPIAWGLRGTRFYRHVALIGGSVVIAVLACVWLVERGFDVRLIGL
jgi:hypothetical protein